MMNKFIALITVSLFTLLGCAIPWTEPEVIQTKITAPKKISYLEDTRRSVFLFASFNSEIPQERFMGSAFLIKRSAVSETTFEYRALTCYHTLDVICDKLKKSGIQSLPLFDCVFQLGFHNEPMRMTCKFQDIDLVSKTHDWVSFTFRCQKELSCATLASKEEFKQLKPAETLYLIGGSGGMTIVCRKGCFASSHHQYYENIGSDPKNVAWHKYTNDFFRFSGGAWYGDSGGVVCNLDGKVVGLINGFSIMHRRYGPSTTINASLKIHKIKLEK